MPTSRPRARACAGFPDRAVVVEPGAPGDAVGLGVAVTVRDASAEPPCLGRDSRP